MQIQYYFDSIMSRPRADASFVYDKDQYYIFFYQTDPPSARSMYISSYVFVHSSRLGNNFAGILFEHVRINTYF